MEVSFKSRNPNIKEAQKVCRMIRTNFNYVSPSKIEKEMPLAGQLDPKMLKFLYKKKEQIHNQRIDGFFIRKQIKKYEEIIHNIITNKVANCYELSVLTEMLLKANGVKNCVKASLVTNKGKTIDHCVTCILPKNPENRNKIIIIDPWLQECGYLGEMLSKYKNEYFAYFEKLKTPNGLEIKLKDKIDISDKDILKLKKRFKEIDTITINKNAFDI